MTMESLANLSNWFKVVMESLGHAKGDMALIEKSMVTDFTFDDEHMKHVKKQQHDAQVAAHILMTITLIGTAVPGPLSTMTMFAKPLPGWFNAAAGALGAANAGGTALWFDDKSKDAS